MKGKEIIKVILFIVIPLGLVLGMLANHSITEKQYRKMNTTVKEIVEVHLEEILNDYVGEQPQIEFLEKTTSNTTAVTLTKENQQTIIDSVLGSLQPKIYKEINSMSTTIQQKAVSELEERLTETIDTVLKEQLSETVVFTDNEKQILTSSIITVVEKDILTKLEESEAKNEKAIETLKKSVEINIKNMEDLLKDYEAKLLTMKTSISNLQNQLNSINVDNTNSSGVLQKQLNALQTSYSSFRKEYAVNLANTLKLGNIVTDITNPENLTDTNVLAASAAYSLDTKIADLQIDTEKKLNDMAVNVTGNIEQQINILDMKLISLEEQYTDNYDELKAQSATKEELEEAKKSLESADGTIKELLKKEEDDRIAAINDAKNALEQAIDLSGSNASDALKQARDELQRLIDENISDISTIDTALQNAQLAIINNKSALDNEIANINNRILNMSNDITNVHRSVQQIVDSQPIYTWETDGVSTTLKIEIQ